MLPPGCTTAVIPALYDALAGDRLTFLYSGRFHDEHTARLITLGEEFLEHDGTDKSVRGKLAFIMVEAYQNIIRHRAALSEGMEPGSGRSLFVLRSRAAQHEVTAINPVVNADVRQLTTALEALRHLDLKQMKQVFLRGLQSDERTERGGAGLGLIEMARRSGHALQHSFAPLGADHQLFALRVLIGKAAAWQGTNEGAFSLHRTVVVNDISVLCRGHLASGEQEVVMRIIERDLDEDRQHSDARMRAFLATTELLENLGVRGEGPLTMLTRSTGKVALVTGIPLDTEAADRLTNAVREVNALDAQGLQRRYRDILLGRGEIAGTMQLGLIDLARRSTAPLRLEHHTWRNAPFLSLEVLL